jgi:hypothetical protein
LIWKLGQNLGWASGISRSAWASGVRGQRESLWRTRLNASEAETTSRGISYRSLWRRTRRIEALRTATILIPGDALQRLPADAI